MTSHRDDSDHNNDDDGDTTKRGDHLSMCGGRLFGTIRFPSTITHVCTACVFICQTCPIWSVYTYVGV